jgi:MFS transporter, ACS family, tartrate transporter
MTPAFSPDRAQELEKSVVSKVLRYLIPLLAVFYMFNLLDRGNIGIAALTMKDDLGFDDRVYGLGAGIFFIGYFLFEIPSNIIMEKVGARLWIARIMFTWGIVSTSMMFVNSPTALYVLRFLLGVAEAGFFPGIILYLTYWIPAAIRGKVLGRFLAVTGILGLLGGPIGGVLLKLDGIWGLQGWQWLFLIEGLPSILGTFFVLKFLPDGPRQAKWLSEDEKAYITAKLDAENKNTTRLQHLSLKQGLSDSRLVKMCLIFLLAGTAGNAVGSFFPQILKAQSGGAWSDSFIATVTAFPALMGAIAMVIATMHSDKSGKRKAHVIGGYSVAALGFVALIVAPTAGFMILAMTLNNMGERSAAGSYWTLTTNLLGPRAAAAGIALINSVGNLGGFFGPYLMGEILFRTNKNYDLGIGMGVAFIGCAVIVACMLRPTSEKVEEDNTPLPA